MPAAGPSSRPSPSLRRRLLGGALSAALSLSVVAACSSDPGTTTLDATGCEGAKKDQNGVCRRPNGQFAKKVCCAGPAPFPTARRTLEAFACPAGDAPIPVAFFDADSTLRISRGGSPTANTPTDVYVLPFAAQKIAELNRDGYLVAVVSNQGGVSSGHTPLEVAEGALVFVGEQLSALGAEIDYLDFSEANDEFRKPNTGMAELLDTQLLEKCGVGIDFEASFMVGDAGYKQNVDGPHPDGRPADDFSNSDRIFAENLGIPFSEPTDYFGWRSYEVFNIRYKSQLLALLTSVDEEIAALEASGDDPERLEALRDEVRDNRRVNDLE